MALSPKLWLPNVGLYVGVGIDFTSNWNTTSPSYTDVSARMRRQAGIQWQRGQNQTWDKISPGSFSFTLDNRDGGLDPVTNSNMVGSRLCQIVLYYPDTASPSVQFTGVVDSFIPVFPSSGKDATVEVSGVDLLTSLWLSKILSVGVLGNTAVSQLQTLANVAGIPAAWQSFTAGSYSLKVATYQGTDVLSAMSNVAGSQVQFLYVSKGGVVTTVPIASGAVTQTYGDSGGANELPYTDVKGRVGGAGTYTVVQLSQSGNIQVQSPGTNSAGVTQTVPSGSTANTQKFGRQVLPLSVAALTNPQSACDAWAGVVPTPATYWFTDLQVKPLADPARLIPAVLAHELGDRITVKNRPLYGGTNTKSATIRSVSHKLSGDDWTVDFTLTNR